MIKEKSLFLSFTIEKFEDMVEAIETWNRMREALPEIASPTSFEVFGREHNITEYAASASGDAV